MKLRKGQIIEGEHQGYHVYVGKIVRIQNGKVTLYDYRNPNGHRHNEVDIATVEGWLARGTYRIKEQTSYKDYDKPEVTLSP